MTWLLEAGPFEARDGEDRLLFESAHIRLEAGQLMALEGPSGSGKSSLLRLLTGLNQAPSARRSLEGQGFSTSQLSAWRARVTLLAQDAPTVPGSLRLNLELPFQLKVAAGRAFPEDEARRLLDVVGLGAIPLERDVQTLSGGERQRLALVRGLLWDPTVLVADEPLAALDEEAAETCFELLLSRARRPGRAVLCSLHHRRLAGLADAVLLLHQGRLERSR